MSSRKNSSEYKRGAIQRVCRSGDNWRWVFLSFALSLSVMITFGCNKSERLTKEIDEQATLQAPWEKDEIITKGKDSLGIPRDIRFLGITTQGYYLGQQFYSGEGKKRTDPYLSVCPDDTTGKYKFWFWQECKITGLFVVWYPNGEKYDEGHYLDGKRNGLRTLWYSNGQKQTETHYQKGKRQGIQTEWYENGQKKEEGVFRNGEKHGVWIEWYKNGQKESEGAYQRGEEQGLWVFWYPNGQKISESHYQKGKMHGTWTGWYPNGMKSAWGNFQDGKVQGLWIWWNPNGEKSRHKEF